MPYKNREDKAAQMRRYRKRQREKMDKFKEMFPEAYKQFKEW